MAARAALVRPMLNKHTHYTADYCCRLECAHSVRNEGEEQTVVCWVHLWSFRYRQKDGQFRGQRPAMICMYLILQKSNSSTQLSLWAKELWKDRKVLYYLNQTANYHLVHQWFHSGNSQSPVWVDRFPAGFSYHQDPREGLQPSSTYKSVHCY